MGLETATYVSDLDANNPLAADKKNQGDDHFRLLKAVLKNTLPNADRAWRMPEVVSKTANYGVLVGDENKTILCDTTAGAFTVTLPTPTFDGWLVRVVKSSTDVNPVYVAPPSGTINGLAKMRCNVPYVEYVFLWTGSVFIRLKAPGEENPGAFVDYGGATAPVGFAFPTGQSLLVADHPELALAWGYQWGGSGANFNAPDLRDKFLTQAGSTYALGATGGSTAVSITEAQLPVVTRPLDSGASSGTVSGTADTASIAVAAGGGTLVATFPGQPGSNDAVNVNISGTYTGSASGTVTFGAGNTHENRPPYTAVNRIFRLC